MQEELLHAFENDFESTVDKVACSEQWLLSAVQHHSGKSQFITKYECVI